MSILISLARAAIARVTGDDMRAAVGRHADAELRAVRAEQAEGVAAQQAARYQRAHEDVVRAQDALVKERDALAKRVADLERVDDIHAREIQVLRMTDDHADMRVMTTLCELAKSAGAASASFKLGMDSTGWYAEIYVVQEWFKGHGLTPGDAVHGLLQGIEIQVRDWRKKMDALQRAAASAGPPPKTTTAS
jgi:hypothetical protein